MVFFALEFLAAHDVVLTTFATLASDQPTEKRKSRKESTDKAATKAESSSRSRTTKYDALSKVMMRMTRVEKACLHLYHTIILVLGSLASRCS